MLNNSTKTKSPDNWIYEYDKKLSCIDDTIYNGQVNSALLWDYQTKDDYTNCLQKAWQCDIAKCPLTNAECFNGYTYEEACADIRNYTPSCATNAICFAGLTCTEWQTYIDEHSGGLKCGWTIGYTCKGIGYPPSYNGICIYNCCCNSTNVFCSIGTDIDSPSIDLTSCVRKNNAVFSSGLSLWSADNSVDSETSYASLYSRKCVSKNDNYASYSSENGVIVIESNYIYNDVLCNRHNTFCHSCGCSLHSMKLQESYYPNVWSYNNISQSLTNGTYTCSENTSICCCNRYRSCKTIQNLNYDYFDCYCNGCKLYYDNCVHIYCCYAASLFTFSCITDCTKMYLHRANRFGTNNITLNNSAQCYYSSESGNCCFTSEQMNSVEGYTACSMMCASCDFDNDSSEEEYYATVCFLLKVSCSEPSALLEIDGDTRTCWTFCCDGNLYKNGVCVL